MSEVYFYMIGNKYIAIDNASGGYPCETDNPLDVHTFSSKEKAEKYKAMFSDDWMLCKFLGLNYEPIITVKK